MATWTEADLATAALKHMGVLGAGQSPEAEDLAEITDSWQSIFANLRTEGLAPFAIGAIPVEAQHSLAHIMADANVTSFGITGERAAMLAKEAADAMVTLRREYAAAAKKLPTRARYF